MVILYVILSILINGVFGLEVEIKNEPGPLQEGKRLELICSSEREQAWIKYGGSCEIKQVDNPYKMINKTWKGQISKINHVPDKKRFYKGSSKRCMLIIKHLCPHDAGEWSCDISYTHNDEEIVETKIFNLTNIEAGEPSNESTPCLIPTTQLETTTESLSIETEPSTETELSTETQPSIVTELSTDSGSISIAAIIGLIITIIFGIVITIVVLAYFDIIKSFSFLPRRSPGLRQVDEMKRENTLRRRARQSMHTFLDYVEKQGKRNSIFK